MPYMARMYGKTASLPDLADTLPQMASVARAQLPAQVVDRVDLCTNLTRPNLDPSAGLGQVHFFSTQPDPTLSLHKMIVKLCNDF